MAPMSFCKLINNRERTHHPSNCAPKNLGQHSMDWSRLKSKLEAVAFTSNHRRSCKLSLPPILGNVWKYIIEGRDSRQTIHFWLFSPSGLAQVVNKIEAGPLKDMMAKMRPTCRLRAQGRRMCNMSTHPRRKYGNHLGWQRRIKVLQKVKNVLLKSRCISQKNLEIA